MLCRYVCGTAKCSLAGLAGGAKHLELRGNVVPYTTVRGAAGLEWNTRPGRYMEVAVVSHPHDMACVHSRTTHAAVLSKPLPTVMHVSPLHRA